MENFEKLVDFFCDEESPYRLNYYNDKLNEILITDVTASEISKLIELVKSYYHEDFSFRIKHIYQDWYNVYIYDTSDITKALTDAENKWEQKLNELINEHTSN